MHADGTAVGARGNLATFGFYPNKQLATGEGGALVSPDAEVKERVDSERNQGRAPGHGLARPRPAGLQLPALGPGLRARAGPARAPGARCWPHAPRVAGLYAEALAGIEGLELPCADAGGDRRSWFVYVVQLPPRRGPRRHDPARCARSGIDSKPYLPAIHLMSFYRERFGHREGEFPVCEDVAARSLALPFFPELDRGQVERVAADAARGARRQAPSAATRRPAGR